MPRRKQVKLRKPTLAAIRHYNEKGKRQFQLADGAIEQLIKKFPDNDNEHEVFLKVVAINAIYQTRIWETSSVAERIFKTSIDIRMNEGDVHVVDTIAKTKYKKRDKPTNNISFASKYCYCHRPKYFPIFDRYANDLLNAYNFKFRFSEIKKNKCRTYSKYKKMFDAFREYFKLQSKSYHELDRFLWQYGRDLFAKKKK